MVRKHLPMVLAALLDVDDDQLLQPEAKLGQHIALHEPRQLAVGPAGPQLDEVEVGGGLAVDVLDGGEGC